MKQEHIDSKRTEKVIVHEPLDCFVINTHAFHNVHCLHLIPGIFELLRPKLIYSNRTQRHQDAATILWQSKVAAEPDIPTKPSPSVSNLEPPAQASRKRRRADGNQREAQDTSFTRGEPRFSGGASVLPDDSMVIEDSDVL
jgi:hypothetical protein